MVNVRARQTGAAATIAKHGPATITSATGGTLSLNTGSSDPAFSPIDLLYGAVAGCLAVSARQAAAEMHLLPQLATVNVSVSGKKAADGPARVEEFDIKIEITGDFDAATRAALIARAEELCTVSNTLKTTPAFRLDGH